MERLEGHLSLAKKEHSQLVFADGLHESYIDGGGVHTCPLLVAACQRSKAALHCSKLRAQRERATECASPVLTTARTA